MSKNCLNLKIMILTLFLILLNQYCVVIINFGGWLK